MNGRGPSLTLPASEPSGETPHKITLLALSPEMEKLLMRAWRIGFISGVEHGTNSVGDPLVRMVRENLRAEEDGLL